MATRRGSAIHNREAPCIWTSTATPPSTASWRPSCGKASRAAPIPPARASPPSGGWRPIWAARATPSSRPIICSCRKATWQAAPAAGTSCRMWPTCSRTPRRPPAPCCWEALGGKPATTSPMATWSPAPSPPPPGGPSPTTSCCRWKPPAATPTTTRSGRRVCARPLRGGWSRSATSTAPPSKSSCRAARRPASRTC